MSWLKGVLSGLATPVVGYLQRRTELKAEAAKQERELNAAIHTRQIELISQGLTADMNWEMEFARQASSSWKDEYVLMVVSIPAILCFIPKSFAEWQGGAYYVTQGFEALALTPMWYQILFCSVFAATFGIRWWRRSQSDT